MSDKTKAELQAEIEELKKQLEEKPKEIEIIKEVTREVVKNPTSIDESNAWLEERVPVMLFKDNNNYKYDVPVSVNGETILIKRGIQVKIKRKHALVLQNQYKQQLIASNLQDKFEKIYKSEDKFVADNLKKLSDEARKFLGEWFVHHIMKEDKK
jgi:hypothetical protein